MISRPVLRYHGGKWRLAPWVLSFFPPHRCYVEPYAGAASVLIRKARSSAECLNDRDDRIVNVFRVLRDPGKADELRRRLELTPFARTEFESSYDPPVDEIDAACKTIALSFMGQGSDAVTRGFRTGFRCALRNSDNKALPSHEWPGWAREIPLFVDRLQGVAIECTDAPKVIVRLDSPDTLIYADPPYPHSTRSASRGKHAYRHEMTDDDHRVLATLLHGVKGMVVISGYPCELYDRELYAGWARFTCDAKADRGLDRTEVVWLNPACASKQSQARLFA